MRLDDLTIGLAGGASSATLDAGADVDVTGLAYDSRSVRPGDLFFCVTGFHGDGHDFAPQALESGAVALVVERPLGLGVPEIAVDSVRAAMGPLAARFNGDPTAELRVVGVTGTNGKTTTAYLVRALLEAGGEQCGLLGTVKSVIGGVDREVVRTTPEAIDLQADFRAMLDGGDLACAMEVSSHGLELGRTDGIHFAAAIFTNLSRDHLDFHGTMEDYFRAKRLLFLPPQRAAAPGSSAQINVVNVGDTYGRRLAGELEHAVTFGLDVHEADYRAGELSSDWDRCRFTLDTPAGSRRVVLPMPGRFNVANALGALAAAHALGIDLDTLVGALERGVRVPGRFEPVERGQNFGVLVDYAHTPDSLENVLTAARELISPRERDGARVLCVFGAGGDRDRGKRPLMGEIAARLADLVFVTSDNPRSEVPELIIEEIMAGAVRPGGAPSPGVLAITDRRQAIADAIAAARPGDVLVIAGKGHEQGQEFAGGRKEPFDDATVAAEALRANGLAAEGGAGKAAAEGGAGKAAAEGGAGKAAAEATA
jgi:UDP-N-acetylmuramoyl-L-alanyl-D-glutamate--2,6-diaminopimelate ligase